MTDGAIQFARYAYPPNALGYCGPSDHLSLLEYGSTGVRDAGLVALIREFEGAWPYLELIGESTGLNPLDRRVVSAYWLGGPLLERVPAGALGRSLIDRFGKRAGTSWDALEGAVELGLKPSHAFHVFCVYPWVGLMRSGTVDQPLHVLDRCRIRLAEVVAPHDDEVEVMFRPLKFEDDELQMGDTETEMLRWGRNGRSLVPELRSGDIVSAHWGWACERIGRAEVGRLEHETRRAIEYANTVLARPRTGVFA